MLTHQIFLPSHFHSMFRSVSIFQMQIFHIRIRTKTCVFAISHAKSRFNSNIRLGESILVICTKQRLWPTVSFCRNGKKRFHNMARMTSMHRYKFIDMRGIFPFWISAKSPNAKKIYRKFYNNVCSNGFNVI